MKTTRKTPKGSPSAAAAKEKPGTGGEAMQEIHAGIMRVLGRCAKPVSAYALLDELKRDSERRVYPQTVYRALTVLIERGLVHKLGSVNAFLACAYPDRPHDGIHMICDDCGTAKEIVDSRVTSMLNHDAASARFTKQHQAIEMHGTCGKCTAA